MALTADEKKALFRQAKELRRDVVRITTECGGAHIGGGMSVLDILTILYFRHLNIDPVQPDNPDRDRLILSKGHAAVAFAPVLARRGFFDPELLKTFNKFKSPFGMHPDGKKIPGCDASAGSLGHGLSMAVGLALGARFQKKDWKTYCILGDGECDEGSVWEALMAASHYRLTNLIIIVDRNKLMIDGFTEDVMSLEPLEDKFKAFGMDVRNIDGHDFDALEDALVYAGQAGDKPVLILADTVKGKGVEYMEGNVVWHYGSIDSQNAEKAYASIDAMYEGLV